MGIFKKSKAEMEAREEAAALKIALKQKAKSEREAKRLEMIRNKPIRDLERSKQRYEVAKQRRTNFKKKAGEFIQASAQKMKESSNKPRKPMSNPFGGGMNFGNPLAEFSPKKGKKKKPYNPNNWY